MKKSLLVICKILRHFINIFTADDKYSLLNRDTLTQPVHKLLSQRQKSFSQLFSPFLKFSSNLHRFQIKGDSDSQLFPKLRTPKDAVTQISKGAYSQYHSNDNIVNSLKHCLNLHGGTSTITIYHCKTN